MAVLEWVDTAPVEAKEAAPAPAEAKPKAAKKKAAPKKTGEKKDEA
jgi:hypothetical protein